MMALGPIDEEKGLGHPHSLNAQVKGNESVAATNNSSPAVSTPQLTSLPSDSTTIAECAPGEGDFGTLSRRNTFWSRRVDSFKSTLGLGKGTEVENGEESSDDESDDGLDTGDAVIRRIHQQPRGYPRLATFLDSDESFSVYRRFGYLQTRLILNRQDELAHLEAELDHIEHRESQNDPNGRRLLSRRYMSTEKKALLNKIEGKWNSYCQLLSNASSLAAFNRPTEGEHRSVRQWIDNVQPLVPAEHSFIRCEEDLIILRPGREHAWLDRGVEKTIRWLGWAPLRRMFQTRTTREKTDGADGTVLYTRSRIENFVVALITLMILVLLVAPIWALFKLSEDGQKLAESGVKSQRTSVESIGVLLVATLAFSACISLFTRARRHEILAASAAYCAVLVVFIGNLGQYPTSMITK